MFFSAGTRPEWPTFDGRFQEEKERVDIALKLPHCPLPLCTNQLAVYICRRLDCCKIRGKEEEERLQSHPSGQSQSASGKLLCLKYGCCYKHPLWENKKPWAKINDFCTGSRTGTYPTCSSFCLQLRCWITAAFWRPLQSPAASRCFRWRKCHKCIITVLPDLPTARTQSCLWFRRRQMEGNFSQGESKTVW